MKKKKKKLSINQLYMNYEKPKKKKIYKIQN